jgi:hypothetical protein
VALTMAGCSPEPGPFAHKPGTKSTLLDPVSDSGGIVVASVEGATEQVAQRLREALIDALALHDIPAATDGANRHTRFLKGHAALSPRPGGLARIDIAWELTDAIGRPVGSQPVGREVTRAAWEAGDPALIKALARDSASAIATLIQEPAPTDVVRARKVMLHVWPVAGVQKTTGIALRRAMEEALRRRDYTVAAELGDRGLIIAGSVSRGPPGGGRQPVELVWAVLDGGGHELGRLAQKNILPASGLDSALGAAAPAIAEAAAGGMVKLLERLPPARLSAADAR